MTVTVARARTHPSAPIVFVSGIVYARARVCLLNMPTCYSSTGHWAPLWLVGRGPCRVVRVLKPWGRGLPSSQPLPIFATRDVYRAPF